MKRTPLKAGTKISSTGREYIIDTVIGSGATCIVYSGHYIDNAGVSHDIRVKECYPYNSLVERKGEELIWNTEADKEYSVRTFSEAYEKLMKNQMGNFTVNAFDLINANKTLYIIMDSNDGITFDKENSVSIYDILYTIKLLAYVVGEYHKKGYLHLDIKPENFLVFPRPSEHIILFDMDSITSISDIKERKVKGISYSAHWAAPEQIQGKYNKLCPATDIFSIGAVLFNKVMGRNITGEDSGLFAEWDFEQPIFKRTNPKVKLYLNKIFKNTLAANINRRYQNVNELLADIEIAMEYARFNSPYVVSNYPDAKSVFVGRDIELTEVYKALTDNRVVFLSGIGGIGKTSIALEYLNRNRKEYGSILFMRYEKDIETTLKNARIVFRNYKNESHSGADIIDALSELMDENDLIVIDNFDKLDNINDLNGFVDSSLKCKFLITSRISQATLSDMNYYSEVITEMKLEDITRLFCEHNKINYNEEETIAVKRIFNKVECHTLCVELIAKYLRITDVKPTEFYKNLSESLNGIISFDDVKVTEEKDNEIRRHSMQKHIEILFDITELSDKQKEMLYSLSLLDSVRISKKLFLEWMASESKSEDMENLIELGWIETSDSNKISLHQLISDSAFSHMEKNEFKCIDMYEGLNNYFQKYSTLNSWQKRNFEWILWSVEKRVPLECFCNELFALLINYHKFTNDIGSCENIEKCIAFCKKAEDDYLYELAQLYADEVIALLYEYHNELRTVGILTEDLADDITEKINISFAFYKRYTDSMSQIYELEIELIERICEKRYYFDGRLGKKFSEFLIDKFDEYSKIFSESNIDLHIKLAACKCFFETVYRIGEKDFKIIAHGKEKHLIEIIKLYHREIAKIVEEPGYPQEEKEEIYNRIDSAYYYASGVTSDYELLADISENMMHTSLAAGYSLLCVEDRKRKSKYYLAMHFIKTSRPEMAIKLIDGNADLLIYILDGIISQDIKDGEIEVFKPYILNTILSLTEEYEFWSALYAMRGCAVIFNYVNGDEREKILSVMSENCKNLLEISKEQDIEDYHIKALFEELLRCYESTHIEEYKEQAFKLCHDNLERISGYNVDDFCVKSILAYAKEKEEEGDFVFASYLFKSVMYSASENERVNILISFLKFLESEISLEGKAEIAYNGIEEIRFFLSGTAEGHIVWNEKITVTEKKTAEKFISKAIELLSDIADNKLDTYFIARLYDEAADFCGRDSENYMELKRNCNYQLIAEYNSSKMSEISEIASEWGSAAAGYSLAENSEKAYECYVKARELYYSAPEKDWYNIYDATESCIRELLRYSGEDNVKKEVERLISELKEILMQINSKERDDSLPYFLYENSADALAPVFSAAFDLADNKMYSLAEKLHLVRGIVLLSNRNREYMCITELSTQELSSKLMTMINDADKIKNAEYINEFLDWCEEYINYCEEHNTGNQKIKERCIRILAELANNDFEVK